MTETAATDVTRNMVPEAILRQYERTVRPRRGGYRHYEIIAISLDTALTEAGEIIETPTLIDYLGRRTKPVCFVKQGVAEFVAMCDERYDDNPAWQWRGSGRIEKAYNASKGERKREIEKTVIHFFGFKRSKAVYHLALDPLVFYPGEGKRIDDLIPDDLPRQAKLMQWATQLREWCHENNLLLKPTTGGLASQLLRDSRFYPDARRKVPAKVNARARGQLPGNHYRLYTAPRTDREYQAIYLDQRRSHHYHAHHTPLPDANTLYAYGRFRRLDDCFSNVVIPGFAGLYYCDIATSKAPADDPFALHTSKDLQYSAFVWSNEITFLADCGYHVTGIRAAWGSINQDRGIPSYSRWAMSQLDSYQDASWLKPILLSVYGMLAVSPNELAFVFKRAKRGEPITLLAGARKLHGLLVQSTKGRKIESSIANVLHRGLIEAATRVESLGLAEYLSGRGYKVLQVYADAVIIEDDGATELPFIPDPWRVKQTLHHYKPIHSQAFVSAEIQRLPGVSGRERMKYMQGSNRNVPTRPLYMALSGQRVPTNRRI